MKAVETCVPFSCGTQFMDWQHRNCDRCAKGTPFTGHQSFEDITCPMERALCEGAILGEVPTELARRAGWQPHETRYGWECPEKEARDEAHRL